MAIGLGKGFVLSVKQSFYPNRLYQSLVAQFV